MAGWFVPQVDTLGVIQVLDAPAVPDLRESFATLRTNRDEIDEFASLAGRSRPATRTLTLGVQ
jgi:hypothetical protein